MNAMKCRFVVLFSIVGLLPGGFAAFAAPARAVSMYDNVYQTTDSLIISYDPSSQSQYSCPELDMFHHFSFPPEYTLHPNASGQSAYHSVVSEAMG